MNKTRELKQATYGMKASDGDGVQLTRIIGSPEIDMLDPFLLVDAFGSDQPQEYIGGFPPNPHRGFETVTYMFAGKMRHEDSVGNAGVIETGGVQWMRAGKGIIHSEMPEQTEGLLAGMQLWVNLPAANKMDAPLYQEHGKDNIPEERRGNTCRIKVIAGKTALGTKGIVENGFVHPTYWDVTLEKGSQFFDTIPPEHNAFIYVVDGDIAVGNNEKPLNHKQLGILSLGGDIKIAGLSDCRFLLIAGKPLNEAVARGGPFVMNTEAEIRQAFTDYKSGQFA